MYHADEPTEVLLTPELAARWLGDRYHRHGCRERKVETYARDMAEGRWRPGSKIILYPWGTIHNGHHRLLAVLRTGVSISVLVTAPPYPDNRLPLPAHPVRLDGENDPTLGRYTP